MLVRYCELVVGPYPSFGKPPLANGSSQRYTRHHSCNMQVVCHGLVSIAFRRAGFSRHVRWYAYRTGAARQMTPHKEDLDIHKAPLAKRANTCTFPFSGPRDTTSCLPAASLLGRRCARPWLLLEGMNWNAAVRAGGNPVHHSAQARLVEDDDTRKPHAGA